MLCHDPYGRTLSPSSAAGDGLARLEREMERSSLFTHTELSRRGERLREDELLLHDLIDALLAEKGMVIEEELGYAVDHMCQELERRGDVPCPGIALMMSGSDTPAANSNAVSCVRPIHLCQAACCRIHFALTAEDM